MKRFFIIILPVILPLFSWAQSIEFVSPVNIPIVLNGNFGELRGGHFHAGIDIKTFSKKGLPVSVIEAGFVSRVAVSPGGYGKALYVNHPNGYTSVYAHLDAFTPEIEKWVRDAQYRHKSFKVNLFPQKEQFRLKKGERVGFSGNSGSSAGPHLHFEIRKTETEHPVNPLLLNYRITDTRKPVTENLFVYPLSDEGHVEGEFSKKRFNLVFYDGAYRLKGKNCIEGYGRLGFGVDAIDYLDGSWSKCGIYKLELIIDGETAFSFVLDELDYSTMRSMNSHIDYEAYKRNDIQVHKTFVEPGNKLAIYNNRRFARGYDFSDNKLHEVKIVMWDVSGNASEVIFNVQGKKRPSPENEIKNTFRFDENNRFENDEVKLFIQQGALFSNIDFVYDKEPGNMNTFSPLYTIHNEYTPLNKPLSISLKATHVPKTLLPKALIARFDATDSTYSPAGGKHEDGWITARSLNFGVFCIVADTVPPAIKPLSIKRKTELIEKDRIRFRIKDDLSGIKSYTGSIDNEWVLFEYDPKNDMVTYRFDEILRKGKKHLLHFEVSDNKGNISDYNARFYY
ncbi:MAG: M23 family metallopeptidase [Prolixibacteraceae bacterium]|nr:M23 family metallopeptidase [Prolixibacteraceae bacterium]